MAYEVEPNDETRKVEKMSDKDFFRCSMTEETEGRDDERCRDR